jgi:predicted DNA-binding protein with PD1-like motif
MNPLIAIQPVKTVMGRLSHGADLLAELTEICIREKVALGRIEVIGAVQKAKVGFYNQASHEYDWHVFNESMEILSCSGNVSIKDAKPFVHAHMVLSDHLGRAFGGHLAAETILFAGEFVLQAFDGPSLVRGFDETTGLQLWQDNPSLA